MTLVTAVLFLATLNRPELLPASSGGCFNIYLPSKVAEPVALVALLATASTAEAAEAATPTAVATTASSTATSISLRALPSKVAYPVTTVTDRASTTASTLSAISLAPKQWICVSLGMENSRVLKLQVDERYLDLCMKQRETTILLN